MSGTAVVGFTRAGCELARRIARGLGAGQAWAPRRLAGAPELRGFDDLAGWTAARLAEGARQLVFVGACGIAVRAMAPHVASKAHDPAVVCVDEAGRWAIPLLSGHIGGANALARRIAGMLGATSVITTATDVRGVFAVDDWAARRGLLVAEPERVKLVSGALLEGRRVAVRLGAQVSLEGDLPEGLFLEGGSPIFETGLPDEGEGEGVSTPCVHIGPELPGRDGPSTLHLLTRNVVVGVGCRRGCAPEALSASVEEALAAAGLDARAAGALATIDLKADEPAVLELAQGFGSRLETFSAERLAAQQGTFASSEFVREHVGVDNVCERALACCGAVRVAGKRAGRGTTVALGCVPATLRMDDGLKEDDNG